MEIWQLQTELLLCTKFLEIKIFSRDATITVLLQFINYVG